MPRRRLRAIGLAVVVMVAGVFYFTVAEDVSGPQPAPVVTVPPSVTCPGQCDGIAQNPAGGPVSVEASIDGEELPDSPDEEMEGETNEFSFHVPHGNAGKLLKIVATAADGTKTTQYVRID